MTKMDDLSQNAIQIIERVKKIYNVENISFISQNCIGGIIYHDMEQKFLTPTINLYLMANDFVKFVENLEYYLNQELIMLDGTEVVTGKIDDLEIYFLHYHSNEEALNKWNDRKQRINFEKIFVIQTDRDGFDDDTFTRFKRLPYPKALITGNEKWKDEEFVIYLPKYKDVECVPDTIPEREFYVDNKIIKLINKCK